MFRTLTIVSALLFASNAFAAGQPILKDGPCPSGYHQSNNYCVPGLSNTGQAILKDGPCPSGFAQSNNYCVAQSPSAIAILKSGPCPSGTRQSNKYCVSN
jgi:hypothetical protein